MRGISLAVLFLLVGCGEMTRHLAPQEQLQRQALRYEVLPIIIEAGARAEEGSLRSLTEARALLNLARERAGDTPEILDGFGCISLRLGMLSEAESFFRQAITADRTFAQGYAHLSAALISAGRVTEGRESLAEALRLNPFDRSARLVQQRLLTGEFDSSDIPSKIAAGSREHEELMKGFYVLRGAR